MQRMPTLSCAINNWQLVCRIVETPGVLVSSTSPATGSMCLKKCLCSVLICISVMQNYTIFTTTSILAEPCRVSAQCRQSRKNLCSTFPAQSSAESQRVIMRTTAVTLVSFIGNSLSSGHLDGVSSCFRKCGVHSRLPLMLMLMVIEVSLLRGTPRHMSALRRCPFLS